MKKLFHRLLLGLVLGIGVYAAGAIIWGVDQLGSSLASFAAWRLAPVLALTLLNYLVRYLKWTMYLRVLEIDVPSGQNMTIFCAGLSMVVTPGKVGELLKSYLLRLSREIPMARTAPVVIAERITDLVALVLLMAAGFYTFRIGAVALAVIGGGVSLFLVVVSSPPLSRAALRLARSLPLLRRLGDRLDAFYASVAALFAPGPLALATVLSVASWFCECLGTYVIVGGFPGAQIGLLLATFIYSATTVGGLPTPGGLGLTEGGMAAMLHYVAHLERGVAGAATFLVRLCTLWFAVVVGVLALLLFRRSVGFGSDAEQRLLRRG